MNGWMILHTYFSVTQESTCIVLWMDEWMNEWMTQEPTCIAQRMDE
jgi:hypothetical protein